MEPLPYKPERQNSAGRLLALLRGFSDSGKNHVMKLAENVVGMPTAGGNRELYNAALILLTSMQELYAELCKDLEEADIPETQRPLLIEGLRGIGDKLCVKQLDAGFSVLNAAELSILRMCGTYIKEDGEVTRDDLETIKSAISDLQSLVDSSTISPTLKKSLLELIRLAQDAISRFHIHGAQGLKRAFKAMLGEAAELYCLSEQGKDRAELTKSSAWSKILDLLKTFDAVASKSLKYKPLLESGAQLFIGDQLK